MMLVDIKTLTLYEICYKRPCGQCEYTCICFFSGTICGSHRKVCVCVHVLSGWLLVLRLLNCNRARG